MNQEIVEMLMSHFGRTGAGQRPRIRKFHAELLYTKFALGERVLKQSELDKPKEYVDRMVKYSRGFLDYINEEAGEILLTDKFQEFMHSQSRKFNTTDTLSNDDKTLKEQGIELQDEEVIFDKNLNYQKFYKVVSDESEGLNDPKSWKFDMDSIPVYESVDFSDKENEIFSSNLIGIKLYVLRKIDEVAFVTSRYVQCPSCNTNYSVPASKIDFQTTYKCERPVGDKVCNTPLKKFPARKMIPTYIYEAALWVKSNGELELKEFFVESFSELSAGFHTGYVFGRTEAKSNSFYFTCLKAHKEKSKVNFEIITTENGYIVSDIVNSLIAYARKIGFVLDEEKARLPMYIETMKRLNLVFNKEMNLAHSLYYGAPGIGKTYALSILHHAFFSNSGFISGPRFSLPGLTGGQKEVIYQDTSKKKNVPGLFSSPAFIFDEINNDQFLADDKAINLFKSVALSPSGTSSTVGGKEFPRTSLVAGTANYDMEYLKHYENRVAKEYMRMTKSKVATSMDQQSMLAMVEDSKALIPEGFDYFCDLKDIDSTTPQELTVAVMRTRDDENHYLTKFPKPLMERFYFTVLVHPKFDKSYMRQKSIDVYSHLQVRKSDYNLRELMTMLFITELENKIMDLIGDTATRFTNEEVERAWAKQVEQYLTQISAKYHNFFSMFHRIQQVHVYILFTLTMLEKQTTLTHKNRRFFERIISLLHTPIDMKDFHNPDFENFTYLGESKSELLRWIEAHPNEDIREAVDFDNRKNVRISLAQLETSRKINNTSQYKYEVYNEPMDKN